ncbi:MAG: hypothetical protein LBK12_07835, partial [Odoribacteraceae bacterium]|nr:hypothetical protein [Odoribacteraceae bacterium]
PIFAVYSLLVVLWLIISRREANEISGSKKGKFAPGTNPNALRINTPNKYSRRFYKYAARKADSGPVARIMNYEL